MKNRISLIIPTKDEPYIGTLIGQLRKTFKRTLEIIVIEKGTKLPKLNAKVVRQKTDGLGNAFFEALKYTHGDIIANMDGDGSHRPEDLKKMLDAIRNADLVIGSKLVRGAKSKDELHRRIITIVANKVFSLILGLGIKDYTCGFFVVRRKVLDKVRMRKISGFKMLFPIAYTAKANGFRMKEVQILFEKRIGGKSKMSIAKEIFYELRMAIILRLGLY